MDDEDVHEPGSKETTGRWTREEHHVFIKGLEMYGKAWKKIAMAIKTRTVVQIRTHAQKYFLKLSKARQNGDNLYSRAANGARKRKPRLDRPASISLLLQPFMANSASTSSSSSIPISSFASACTVPISSEIEPGAPQSSSLLTTSVLSSFLAPSSSVLSTSAAIGTIEDRESAILSTGSDEQFHGPVSTSNSSPESSAGTDIDGDTESANEATTSTENDIIDGAANFSAANNNSIVVPKPSSVYNQADTDKCLYNFLSVELERSSCLPSEWYQRAHPIATLLTVAERLDWNDDCGTPLGISTQTNTNDAFKTSAMELENVNPAHTFSNASPLDMPRMDFDMGFGI